MDTYTIQITSQAKEHLTLIRDYITQRNNQTKDQPVGNSDRLAWRKIGI